MAPQAALPDHQVVEQTVGGSGALTPATFPLTLRKSPGLCAIEPLSLPVLGPAYSISLAHIRSRVGAHAFLGRVSSAGSYPRLWAACSCRKIVCRARQALESQAIEPELGKPNPNRAAQPLAQLS